ncbi:breast cancer type 2 susceptibility protein homolog [Dendronephthya gigantea]|uniref:breast cancer type 2 susceptibility protein homolog n=1 Tax=Dendronephthya gigantea TaxID=151771 RepID=UPI00106B5B3B|nr:breast cancer type 2 susceptibility protein homolog [Dendronephthya gigantea]
MGNKIMLVKESGIAQLVGYAGGLGKVSENFKNDEDLTADDFNHLGESSIHKEVQGSKNERNELEFKTPTLVKSILSTNHSPSLFSPLPPDNGLQKGPNSSTPLPWRSSLKAAFTVTPKTAKHVDQNNFWRPEHTHLDYSPYDHADTRKLSASLAMDTTEMNVSWSSSLATPHVPGCGKQHSQYTENFRISSDQKRSFQLSQIQSKELDTAISVERNSKPKGVVRILFQQEMKDFKTDVQISEDRSFENVQIYEKKNQCGNSSKRPLTLNKAVLDDGGHGSPNKVGHTDFNSSNYFDMSSLSPVNEEAINKLLSLPLANIHNSPPGVRDVSNVIEKNSHIVRKLTQENGLKKLYEIDDVHMHLSHGCSVNERAVKPTDPDNHNLEPIAFTNNNSKEDKDFKNLLDMDALSELPMDDIDVSRHIMVPSKLSIQGQENILVDHGQTYNPALYPMSDRKVGACVKSSVESLNSDAGNNKEVISEVKSEKHEGEEVFDMDALSEIPMDFDFSEQIVVTGGSSLISGKRCVDLAKPNHDRNSKCNIDTGQKNTSTKKIETASQVIEDLSLQQLSDISLGEESISYKHANYQIRRSPPHEKQNTVTLDKENNHTLTAAFNVRKCQNENSLSAIVGFSTASGKKITISEKSMQNARQLLNEVNISLGDEKVINNEAGILDINRKKVIGKFQDNSRIEKVLRVGICSTSWTKVDVSLFTSTKIVNDVLREENEECEHIRKSVVNSPGIGYSALLKNKVDVPMIASCGNAALTNESKDDMVKIEEVEQNMTTNFTTVSRKDTNKAILDEYENMLEFSEGLTEDFDKLFADLEKEKYVNKASIDKNKKKDKWEEKDVRDPQSTFVQSNPPHNNVESPNKSSTLEEDRRVSSKTCGNNNIPSVIGGASGRQDEVIEHSLQREKRILDIPNPNGTNDQVKGGLVKNYHLDSGNIATLSNVSSEKEKSVINHEENERCFEHRRPLFTRIPQFGFSTASGKEIKISEVALTKARSILKDVDNQENQTIPQFGFSTASGKEIKISEVALTKARSILKDVDNQENQTIPQFGFSTASGKEIKISEVALTKARSILKDVDNQENQTIPQFGFSTASGKEIKISEEALTKARSILKDVDNQENQTIPQFGFSTASGKEIKISEESLTKAQRILKDVDNQENQSIKTLANVNRKVPSPTSPVSNEPVCFTFGNNVGVSETPSQKYESNSNRIPKFDLPSASDKRISISEEVVKKTRENNETASENYDSAERTSCKENEESAKEAKSSNAFPKSGFSTASGNEITVSEESLKNARKFLNEVDKEGHWPKSKTANKRHDVPRPTPSTANIGIVQKPERALQDKENEENRLLSKFGFTTASGNNIVVSAEALKKARNILNEVDNEGCHPNSKISTKKDFLFSTASDVKIDVGLTSNPERNVNVCETERIFDVQDDKENVQEKLLNKIPKFAFTTASGNKISVSEESVRNARKILCEKDNEEPDLNYETREFKHSSGGIFPSSTPSTANLKVDQKAERIVEDKEDDGRKMLSKTPKLGFTTASGNDIVVSDEALEKARNILNEVDNEVCRPPKLKFSKKEDFQFLTASLTKANVGLSSASETEEIFDVYDDKENVERKLLHKVPMAGFTTAFGNEIAVSEESVRSARKILNEKDGEEPNLNFKGRDLNARSSKRNAPSSKKPESVEDIKKSINNKHCVEFSDDGISSRIPESPLCDIVIPTKMTGNKNDAETKKSHKRTLSEIETNNDRSRKVSKTEKETETKQHGVESNDRNKNLALQSVTVSANLDPDKQKTSSDLLVDGTCKTPLKEYSRFSTPYRAMETTVRQGNSRQLNKANTRKNCSESTKKKTNNANNKECSIKPQAGSIYKLRNNASLKAKRISFANLVGTVKKPASDERVNSSAMSVTSGNAKSYRFKGSDFLSEDVSVKNAGVTCTDGAVLFLGEDKNIGLAEFTKAFLSSPGVDPNLISELWIANHYAWIVWKLSSYELSYPSVFTGRALTPDMVLRQLKYRYDREVDHCERSAVKKILEKDDCPSRSLVLCVASLDVTDIDEGERSKGNTHIKHVEKIILMTDGWYSIRVMLDEYLQNLVKEKKIYVGQKLYIQGAELCGSDQAVSPLEAPTNLHLRIHGNSTRPAKKFARLGFHCKNNLFTVPIKSISTTGGLVSSINVIVTRQYPLQFMEKLPDGKCVFRSPRCEERVSKKFQDDVQRKRDKIMSRVEKEIKDEVKSSSETQRNFHSVSMNEIQNLSDGKEIFDAVSNASDPMSFLSCLSNEQKKILNNYKENLNKDRADNLRRKYEKAWNELAKKETLKRDVVPVLKVKIVDGCASKTKQTLGTALLTVWRPNEQTITMLGEEKRLKVFNLQVSRYKGNKTIQLSANRSTIYKSLPFDATYQNTFEARKLYTFREISDGLRPNIEVDVVAIVISCSTQNNLNLVYLADSDLNLVRIKVWGGLESQCLQEVFKERNYVAACNLLSQPDRRSGIPSLKYYELSLVTSNPSNKKTRSSLYKLKKAVSDPDSFIEKAKAKLDGLYNSSWSTPKAQQNSFLDAASGESMAIGKRRRTTETPLTTQNKKANTEIVSGENSAIVSDVASPLASTVITPKQNESILQTRKRLLQEKRRKLDLLGNPPPISPIPNAVPASVKKQFQTPKRIRTQVDDTENEEE